MRQLIILILIILDILSSDAQRHVMSSSLYTIDIVHSQTAIIDELQTEISELDIDLQKLREFDQIRVKGLELNVFERDIRSAIDYSIFFTVGSSSNIGVITVMHKKIMSQFDSDGYSYTFDSDRAGMFKLLKSEIEDRIQFECTLEINKEGTEKIAPNYKLKTNIDDLCRIRVLILWDPSIVDEYDIPLVSQNSLDNTNIICINSNLSARLELAKAHIYDNANCGISSCGLFVNSTPWFPECDEIPDLRNQYEADLAMAITTTTGPTGGGSACDIPDGSGVVNSNRSKANIFVSTSYPAFSGSSSSYLFEHELGHLIGGRHNPENENATNTPTTARGWRFVHNSLLRGTVMSYHNLNIPHYSNPNVLWSGVPSGTSTANNVAHMSTTEQTVRNNRQVSNDLLLDGETLDNHEVGNHIALSTIETQDATSNSDYEITISNGGKMSMRCPQSIRLKPGFHSSAGSTFHGYIADPCTTSPELLVKKTEELAYVREFKKPLKETSDLVIYPNPSADYINISLSKETQPIAYYIISSSLGVIRKVKLVNTQVEAIKEDIRLLSNGHYYFVVEVKDSYLFSAFYKMK